jgi:hypothetical protein
MFEKSLDKFQKLFNNLNTKNTYFLYMSITTKLQELQNNILKTYSSRTKLVNQYDLLNKFNDCVVLFQDENFVLNYNKKTEVLTLETTYSNQKITNTFLEKLDFLQNISKSYFKLETE